MSETQGGKRDDVKALKHPAEQLIDSYCPKEFDAFTKGWSEGFLFYFDDHLKADNCENKTAYHTKQFCALKDKTPTENINRMIKS